MKCLILTETWRTVLPTITLQGNKNTRHLYLVMFQIFNMVSSHSKFPLEGRSPSFLRKLFRWVLISLSQSLSSKLCLGEHTGGWQRKRRDGEARWSCRDITIGWTLCMKIHFFLSAFCADFVTFPPEVAFFSTDLMTPTATVCLMSRTAKRPEQGKIYLSWAKRNSKLNRNTPQDIFSNYFFFHSLPSD